MNQAFDSQTTLNTMKIDIFQEEEFFDNESPILDHFLLNLRQYIIKESVVNKEIVINSKEFIAIWSNYQEEITLQMKKLDKIFNKNSFDQIELDVISSRIQEKIEVPLKIQNMSFIEEFEHLSKRKINNENSWYLLPRLKFLSDYDLKFVKNSSLDQQRLVKNPLIFNISGELDKVGLMKRTNYSDYSSKNNILKRIKTNEEFSNNFDKINLYKENSMANPRENSKENPRQNFTDHSLVNSLINSSQDQMNFDWVKIDKVLFCRILLPNDSSYYEYAPYIIEKISAQLLETRISQGVIEGNSFDARNRNGILLEEYIEEIRGKWKDIQQKVDFVLLSMLGKAKGAVGKAESEELQEKKKKRWAELVVNYVKKNFREKVKGRAKKVKLEEFMEFNGKDKGEGD